MLMPLKKLHLLFTKECITIVELIIFLERLNNTDENFNLNFQLYICTKQNEEIERCFISSTVKKKLATQLNDLLLNWNELRKHCAASSTMCFKFSQNMELRVYYQFEDRVSGNFIGNVNILISHD